MGFDGPAHQTKEKLIMNNEDIYHTLDIVISDMHTLVFNLTKIRREMAKRRHEEEGGGIIEE